MPAVMHRRADDSERGQALPLFVIAIVVLLMGVALTIDGSNAWVERRRSQNAADMAAMAAAKVVMEGGTDLQVRRAIDTLVAANGRDPVTYGAANNGPRYVDSRGAPLNAWVGGGRVPSGARGVTLSVRGTWRPYFANIFPLVGGSSADWTAPANATVKYGFVASDDTNAGVAPMLPIAVSLNTIPSVICPLPTPAPECPGGDKLITLTDAASGQHGWMSWNGTGNVPYLRWMVGPPANHPTYTIPRNSHIEIPGMSGNKNALRRELDAWALSKALIYVPIVSPGSGNYPASTTPYPPVHTGGTRGAYNVIGFAGVQLTRCINPCITNLRGVFRTGLVNSNGIPVPIYETNLQLVK